MSLSDSRHPATAGSWPRAQAGGRAASIAALAMLAVTLAVVMVVATRSPQKDDVAWLLYVARKWLGGQRLYIDLVEVNPPLIIWLYAIPAKLAMLLGLAPKTVANPFFAAIILGSSWWTACLLHGRAALFARRAPVFGVLGTLLLVLPGVEFGQREHLLAAAVLPYLVLLVRGLDGEREPRHHAIAAGVVAGLACALKPNYAIAFLLMEVMAALRGHRMVRWASVSAGVAMLVYGVAILVFTPAFITKAVPLALALYGGTDTSQWRILSQGYRVLVGQGVALLLCWGSAAMIGRRSPFLRHLLLALTAFAVGSTLVFMSEGKDWFYHRLPASAATILALLLWSAVMLPGLARRGPAAGAWMGAWANPDTRRIAWRAPLAGFALLLFALAGVERVRCWVDSAMRPSLSTEVKLERLIRKEHARTYIAFSEWIALGFPVVNDTGVPWASRFDSMWALKGELWRARQDGTAPKEWPSRTWVARDFVANCPGLAVVDTRKGENWVGVLVAAYPEFALAWTHSHEIAAFDGLRVLKHDGTPCAAEPEPDEGSRLLRRLSSLN